MDNIKRFADIGGNNWESELPFCGGCDEFVIGSNCAWQGNGCKYPDRRTERPQSFQLLCLALIDKYKVSDIEQKKIEDEFKKQIGL